MGDTNRDAGAVEARHWHARLGNPPARAGIEDDEPVLLRFRGIDGAIDQPALRQNVLALHLGGAKRVTRLRGRHREVFDVGDGALTIMPAFEAFRWRTEGPIDFAHLTVAEATVRRILSDEFDREPNDVRLAARVNVADPTVGALFAALLADLERPMPGELYRESLIVALLFNVVGHFSTAGDLSAGGSEPWRRNATGGLAGWQKRRVLDHLRAHLAEPVRLADLVSLTGLSRAQFFRAFRRSTGRSPYALLTQMRVEHARELLHGNRIPIESVAGAVGLDPRQLSTAFRREFGVSPSGYRREIAAGHVAAVGGRA